ncbi:hypothetical protein C8T65DRAFT_692418 [Cerioporus squamosus]|nr:hypothetical protein C8T65DRAFT_692418 [Cerioporus squamosus]
MGRFQPRHCRGSWEAIPTRNLVIVDLDGDELAFDRTQVPNPPKVSFANDLPRLFREWHTSEILTVNGRGIPVKHWDLFYKKRIGIKQHAWDVVRVQWGNWKACFLVTERETFSSEAMFWAKYSDSEGNRLSFQKILDILQGSRKTDDDRNAAAALWFFDGNLAQPGAHGYFAYRKSGTFYVCTKTQTIASKWRKLLHERKDVAELWELARMACPLSDFNV